MLTDPRFTTEVEMTIPFHDVDMMGVVWHGNYFRYFEIAREALLNQFDYGYRQMKASGYVWPVVDTRVKYRDAVTFEQRIRVRAHIEEVENRLRIAYQIFDVIDAMVEDSGAALAELRVDGGPTRDAYLMQFESDLVGSPIRIASNDEMSGLGAAWACGIALDMYTRDVVDVYGARGIVEPSMPADERAKKIAGWRHAVKSTIVYTA